MRKIFYRRYNHLNLTYIVNRVKVFIYETKNPNNPWLTKDSIKILESLLKENDVGVEFGSGRSTLWILKRVRRLISVESDKIWFESITKSIENQKLSHKIKYHLIQNKKKYPLILDEIKDSSLDFCLIDGIERDLCALKCLSKVKKGGLIIIDNVNWFIPNNLTISPDSRRIKDGCYSDIWENFFNVVKSWRSIWTTNGVNDTCIWFKN